METAQDTMFPMSSLSWLSDSLFLLMSIICSIVWLVCLLFVLYVVFNIDKWEDISEVSYSWNVK